jgi:glycosyltransferase involved in cell wall biosynthesis
VKISFLIPGNEGDVSGGHLYNRAIAKEINAGEHRCELIYAADKESFLEHLKRPHEILLIDAWGLHDIDPEVLQQPFHLLAHHPLALDNTVEGDSEKEIVFWNKAQSIFVTGAEVEKFVRTKTKTSVHLVEPGIDVSFKRLSYPKYPKYLVGLGSFIERKGDLLLLDILKLLPEEVVIHRYGPSFDEVFLHRLKTEIAQNNLQHRFIIHGEISHEEKEKVLQTADIMLFPSLYESFGMAIQESMAYRIPILVSDTPYLRTRFGMNGVVYLGKSPMDWAEEIIRLCFTDEAYIDFTTSCQSTRSFCTWQDSVKILLSAFTPSLN